MTTVASHDTLLERLALQEDELARLRQELAAWKAKVAALPHRSDSDFSTISGRALEPVYTPLDVATIEPLPGDYPVHPRHPSDHVSRSAVDDAPVRRLRHCRRHEPPLQVPAGAGPDRAVGGVRLSRR